MLFSPREPSGAIFRDLFELAQDTAAVFIRGLINLTGRDVYYSAEAQAITVRPSLKTDTRRIEWETDAEGRWHFWGLGRYLLIERL